MKIAVNFDLMDKAMEAKKGFSLKKHSKAVGMCMTLVSPMLVADATLGHKTPLEMVARTGGIFLYYCLYFWFSQKARAGLTKDRAENDLRQLSYKLNDIFVNTNAELLQDTECYKTEYSVKFEKVLPKVEQRKYLNVPVNNDWGNNSRSLVQEHIVGSKEYALSHGEPKEQKVYSLGAKKMVQK
ncbi:MAG: hypothetical protein IJE53_01295 [Bacilli bacterium]|nr:hypothetical protein [Bacilli bacterium]